jgi:8-amino-7-oxononanoate synthase
LFSAIGLKDTVFLYDERAHASIKDGIRLSFAKSYSFEHNKLDDLERLLNKFHGQHIFVVVESLYSMDGDFAPLIEIERLTRKHKAELIVDEAHTGGLFGEQGYCEYLSLPSLPFARIITFGKAYGYHGAVVLGSKTLIDYLINFSRPFIYTTSLSVAEINEIQKKVLHLNLNDRQLKLKSNIAYFREKAIPLNTFSNEGSPIQSILTPTNSVAKALERKMRAAGINVKAILSPTVPAGSECVRISLHSFNTTAEIDKLIQLL